MQHVEDHGDERQKAWCIHCGKPIADIPSNRDHVPTKSLLSKALRARGAEFDRGAGDPLDYLPQVLVCVECNTGFSTDETYLLCVLHALMAGSLNPDSSRHPDAARVLRSNRQIVRQLKAMPDGQLMLFGDLQPFTLHPDTGRIARVVVKNARGHAYHEIGEPLMHTPATISFWPIETLDPERRAAFEAIGNGLDVWPEVGSRMLVRLAEGVGMAGGWIEVEPRRYRYAVDWSGGLTVRSVIWDYLATEIRWIDMA